MECRDKQDVVVWLDLVGFLAFELPVGIVDQDQDARAAVSVRCRGSELPHCERRGGGVETTYMWLSRTNKSDRGSFMRFLQR